jgi:hypothetical protein
MFRRISFQLGGPNALMGVERFRCILPFADFFFAQFQFRSTAKFFVDQKGEGAAGLAA